MKNKKWILLVLPFLISNSSACFARFSAEQLAKMGVPDQKDGLTETDTFRRSGGETGNGPRENIIIDSEGKAWVVTPLEINPDSIVIR